MPHGGKQNGTVFTIQGDTLFGGPVLEGFTVYIIYKHATKNQMPSGIAFKEQVQRSRRQVDLRPRLLHPWRKSYKSRTTASPLQENPCYNTTTKTQEPYDPGLLTSHSSPHTHAECSVINSLSSVYPDLMARDGGLKVRTAQRPSSFFHI